MVDLDDLDFKLNQVIIKGYLGSESDRLGWPYLVRAEVLVGRAAAGAAIQSRRLLDHDVIRNRACLALCRITTDQRLVIKAKG